MRNLIHINQYRMFGSNIHIEKNKDNAYFLLLPSFDGSHTQSRKDLLAFIGSKGNELGAPYYRIYKCNCVSKPHVIDFSSILELRDIEYSAINKFNYNGAIAINFNGLTEALIPFFFGCEQESKIKETLKIKAIDELKVERSLSAARNLKVKEAAKQRDNYHCSIVGCANSFEAGDGNPFVEVHHVWPLCDGGRDELENVICLCSHHHSMVHYANDFERIEIENQIRHIMSDKVKKISSPLIENLHNV